MPFTITFRPSLKHSGLVIKKKMYILYLDTEAYEVFTPEPFRTGPKGCKKCNKSMCLTCIKISKNPMPLSVQLMGNIIMCEPSF